MGSGHCRKGDDFVGVTVIDGNLNDGDVFSEEGRGHFHKVAIAHGLLGNLKGGLDAFDGHDRAGYRPRLNRPIL